MEFINIENYDDALIDYILDEFISFVLDGEILHHRNNNYILNLIPKTAVRGYLIGLYFNNEEIYIYHALEGSYRFDELDKELKRIYKQLDDNVRKNKLVREFLGVNRKKKLEKIIDNLDDNK